ncbi:zinc metalloprotease [Aspergillus homomorphus CBS 101889]|uniref:Extracellular metalloprotease n=1 Tax=Aspergillus homomorphus (strain CBS 101889) TaxID=1450537 RepID=A0A395HTS7_ASPHC|nr:extracellular metalloprotease [Aspergillus homomorphus CBS 101889]RAL10785.1 extracellular metalloprotease [Aspergillus homomorphus CBS 101889]
MAPLHIFSILLMLIMMSMQALCSVSFDRGFCATPAPNENLKAEYRRMRASEPKISSGSNYEAREAIKPIEIETWFHVVSSQEAANSVSDQMIASQLIYLQEAYKNATISYRLKGITRHVNDTWAHNQDEIAMKKALRKGSYSTLNVYFQTDLEVSSAGSARVSHDGVARQMDALSSSVLGFCTLPDPSINASSPRSTYLNDGCNVLAKTMPGGSLQHYNRGGTAVHEIGHWNGLLHTFEGDTCSSSSEGDYIDDTPQQSEPTNGCPAQKDSCPDLPGLDAIHNFMDYSSDECYENFTPDQVQRMRSMWSTMRAGK